MTKQEIKNILYLVQSHSLTVNDGIDKINNIIERAEKEAALAAWMAARHRYSGIVGADKAAAIAFEKWFNQWKEAK